VSQFEFLLVGGALSTGEAERRQLQARRNITAGAPAPFSVRRWYFIWPKAVGDFP